MIFSDYLKTTQGMKLYDGIDIDDTSRDTIYDWFQYRYLVDDSRFYVYFRRELNISLRRYNELVRIELTEIDPLVASYRERELKHTGSDKTERTGHSDITNSGTDTHTVTESGTDGNTVTRTPDLTNEHTPYEAETTKTDFNSNNKKNGSETKTPNLVTEHTPIKQERTEVSYDSETTRNGSETRTPDLIDTSSDTGTQTQKNATKNAPQSISYSAQAGGNLPEFDWQYMSGQTQAERTDDLKHQITHTGSETTQYDDITDGHTGTDTTTVTRTGTETNKTTGTETTQYNDITEAHGGTDTTTVTKTGTEKNHETGTEKTEAENRYGKTVTTTDKPNTAQHTEDGGNTETTYGGIDHEIETGRSGMTPQEALWKYREYLYDSNAFTWLRGRLEKCFLCVYDI